MLHTSNHHSTFIKMIGPLLLSCAFVFRLINIVEANYYSNQVPRNYEPIQQQYHQPYYYGHQPNYQNEQAQDEEVDERPRIRLNFGVHVPAMRIQLPRFQLPKITIRARIRQPDRPSTISLPEFHFNTAGRVSSSNSGNIASDELSFNHGSASSSTGNAYEESFGENNPQYQGTDNSFTLTNDDKSNNYNWPNSIYKRQVPSNYQHQYYQMPKNNYNQSPRTLNQDQGYSSKLNNQHHGTSRIIEKPVDKKY